MDILAEISMDLTVAGLLALVGMCLYIRTIPEVAYIRIRKDTILMDRIGQTTPGGGYRFHNGLTGRSPFTPERVMGGDVLTSPIQELLKEVPDELTRILIVRL